MSILRSSPSAGYEHCSFALRLFLSFIFIFLALSLAPNATQAEDTSAKNLIFILDASGSMKAKIQGKLKMDVAKEVLSGLIQDLPAGVKVGLVAYGHRRKGDCKDVEEIAPLGPLNKAALISKIKALKPLGMTPITYSVRTVAEGLKTLEEETTIVLISDGEETCKADPCAAVKELKDSGIKFVMHVIGFDVGDKEKAQLACIAEAGGGSYYSAKNAKELTVAAKKAVAKKEPPAPKVEQAVEGQLKLKALRNGKPFSAYYEVFKAGEDKEEKEKVTGGHTGLEGATIKLPPGTYDLRVVNNEDAGHPVLDFPSITIVLGKSEEKVADFSGGNLKVKALRNGKPFSAYCKVFKAGGDEDEKKEPVTGNWTGEEGAIFKLQPGTYDLVVENHEDAGKPILKFPGVALEAGKSVEKVADFSGGTLKVKALRNGKPFSAYCKVFKAGGNEEEKKEPVTGNWTGEEGANFKLQPGTYDLVVENHADAGKPTLKFPGVALEAGKSVEKVADFSGGTLKVKALRNGKPFSAYCKVFKAGGDEDQKQKPLTGNWTGEEGANFKLLPGVYDLVVENHKDAGKPTLKIPGVALEAGKSVEKVADFSGGTLKVKALRNGKLFSAYCKVFKADGDEDQKRKPLTGNWTGEEGAKFALPPGVYDLLVENHQDAGKPAQKIPGVAVESGKSVEKVADFSGGTLKINALRDGKPISAHCKVFKAVEGEERKKPLIDSWTKEGKADFKLPPGVYEVVVESKETKEKKEFKGINIDADKTQSLTAQF